MSVSSPIAVTVFDVFMRTAQAAPGSVFLSNALGVFIVPVNFDHST